MLPRFYIPDVDSASAQFELPADEAAHLLRVLRLSEGDAIEVFDGRGGVWKADVVHADKHRATVRRHAPVESAAEPRIDVLVAISVLKANKMDDIVRDLVMIGAAAIQPLTTEQSEAHRAALEDGHRVARWQRIAVASAKQCRRAVVPTVRDVRTLQTFLQQTTDATRLLCVEPAAGGPTSRSPDTIAAPRSAHVIVGPEGGWTSDEVQRAREADVILLTLGPRVLRADAVPLIAVTALFSAWGELS